MVVKLRLARFGRRHAPVYNIVVAHARTARNSRPLEVIGTYDPIPKPPSDGVGKPVKDIQLDTSRAKYWLGVGAQPTDPVWRLFSMFGLLEPKWPISRIQAKNPKAGPKEPRPKEPRPKEPKAVVVEGEGEGRMVEGEGGVVGV